MTIGDTCLLTSDERGASTISYAILLPLFVMLLLGGYYVWEIIAMRQALDRATYLAVRELAMPAANIAYTRPDAEELRDKAWEIIFSKLEADPLIYAQFARHEEADLRRDLTTDADIDPFPGQPTEREGPVQSSVLFEIRATLRIPWLVQIPFLQARQSFSVSSRHIGSFYHSEYFRRGQRPSDPEGRDWHVSPWPSSTPATPGRAPLPGP